MQNTHLYRIHSSGGTNHRGLWLGLTHSILIRSKVLVGSIWRQFLKGKPHEKKMAASQLQGVAWYNPHSLVQRQSWAWFWKGIWVGCLPWRETQRDNHRLFFWGPWRLGVGTGAAACVSLIANALNGRVRELSELWNWVGHCHTMKPHCLNASIP